MALNNYTALLTSIGSWLSRGDTSTIAPDIVTLAEARINRDLLTSDRLASATGTLTSPLALPTNHWSTKSLTVGSGGGQIVIRNVSLEEYAMFVGGGGNPAVFAENNGQLLIAPSASGTYTLRYYAKIPDLATNSTNWLLTKYPDIYLWACLVESNAFFRNDNRSAVWDSKYATAISAALIDDERATFGGSILRQRAVLN